MKLIILLTEFLLGFTNTGTQMDWNQHEGGQRWRMNDNGYIEIEGEGVTHTSGMPITAHTILEDFEGDIFEASKRFGVEPATIIAMIWKESLPGKGLHRQIVNKRYEPGYVSDVKTPNKVSFGVMQTLISTAQQTNRECKIFRDVDGNVDVIDRHDLKTPRKSILLGGAYLAKLIRKYGTDPVLLQAAYNAGGVYTSRRNRWRLVMNSPTRADDFIKYYNDAVKVLELRKARGNVT